MLISSLSLKHTLCQLLLFRFCMLYEHTASWDVFFGCVRTTYKKEVKGDSLNGTVNANANANAVHFVSSSTLCYTFN